MVANQAKPKKPKAKAKAKMGRPSKYTKALSESICSRIAGGESLVRICKSPNMPNRVTVLRWIASDEDFCNRYARAREAQADCLFEEILEIADNGSNDTYVDKDGKECIDYDVIARSKLRVDARKWAAAKLAPKKYGDKIQQEISGKDGQPLSAPVNNIILTPEKLEEVARRLSSEV